MKINAVPFDAKKISNDVKRKYITIQNKIASRYLTSYITSTGLIDARVNRTDPLLKIINKEDLIVKPAKPTVKNKPDRLKIKDMMWKLMPTEHGLTWAIIKAIPSDIHK